MATVEFHFKVHQSWNMGAACGNPSTNPAPTTTACIYIIHNKKENTTYIGYADNAKHRWNGRTEVFHTLGIPVAYGQEILCAYCLPTMSSGSMFLEGANACEHLLIRAVVRGVLGPTTNTNTQLATTFFSNASATKVEVYLPSDPWGKLEGAKYSMVSNPF